MPTLSALAYGFATTFKMRDLAPCFAGAKVRQAKTEIVAEYGPDRLAVGFDFGAIVFINVPGEERTRAIGAVLARVATDEPHPPLEEDFLIEIRENAPPQGEVRFDRVIVPALDPSTVDVISILLAQSVAIDYYEEDLQEILAGLARRTDYMARTGRIQGSTREITRFVGSSISTKNQILAALSLLDKPIATWESEDLDRLFRALRTTLEIEDRYQSLADKLKTIQETFELFLDLITTRRAQLMEMTIILLIAFEIAMALVQKL